MLGHLEGCVKRHVAVHAGVGAWRSGCRVCRVCRGTCGKRYIAPSAGLHEMPGSALSVWAMRTCVCMHGCTETDACGVGVRVWRVHEGRAAQEVHRATTVPPAVRNAPMARRCWYVDWPQGTSHVHGECMGSAWGLHGECMGSAWVGGAHRASFERSEDGRALGGVGRMRWPARLGRPHLQRGDRCRGLRVRRECAGVRRGAQGVRSEDAWGAQGSGTAAFLPPFAAP